MSNRKSLSTHKVNTVDKIVQSAAIAFLGLSSLSVFADNKHTVTVPLSMEKCYGVVKAGMNDCQTKTDSCAGSAKKDKQSDAFIFLPKGVCSKIADGRLTEDGK